MDVKNSYPLPLITDIQHVQRKEKIFHEARCLMRIQQWKDFTSECTALLSQKLGVGGVLDSGFSSCAAPTYYCGSKYFYSQHPQVQNLIGTEHSLNRCECRIKNKASLRVFLINQKLDSRGIPNIWESDYGSQS